MATYNSDFYAGLDPTRINTSRLVNRLKQSGKIEVAQPVFTPLATPAIVPGTDTIKLLELPNGAIVIPQLCSVSGPALASLTWDVGEAANPIGLADAIAVAAGGTFSFASVIGKPAYRLPTPLTADAGEMNGNTTIYATPRGAVPTSAMTFYWVIVWKAGR